jgi:hypothetical protein
MVRLPALRSQLQILHAQDETLRDLCDAYDDATRTLNVLQNQRSTDRGIIADYEGAVLGIESQVLERCSSHRPAVR